MIMGLTLEAKACKADTNDGEYKLLFHYISRSQEDQKYGGSEVNLKPWRILLSKIYK